MTNRDRAEAYYMRLNGSSLQEIADQFGVSKQLIAQFLPYSRHVTCHPHNLEACIFPEIRNFLETERMTYNRFAVLCGMGTQNIYNALTGKANPSKSTIDRILEVTGLPYEVAFRQEEKERDTCNS